MTIYDFKRLLLQKTDSQPFFLEFNMYNQVQLNHLLDLTRAKDPAYDPETPTVSVYLDM